MSIGEHVFHVSVAMNIPHTCSRTAIAHMHFQCCGRSMQRYIAALTATCRLLFNEANEILYQQTTIIFASTRAIDSFFSNRITALQHVRSLSLNCGPAKHLCPKSKSEKRRVMCLLQRHAFNLEELRLCFTSYHGIHFDQQLMSNFWLRNIDRLRGLKHFSVDIRMDTLGPIGTADVPNDVRALTQLRIEQFERILRSRLYEPRLQHKQGHSRYIGQSFRKVSPIGFTPKFSVLKQRRWTDEERFHT